MMKHNNILTLVLTLGLVGGVTATALTKEQDEHQTKVVKKESAKESGMQVVARARLTRQRAAKIALSHVPHGKIKAGELEMEAGVLLWSFDLSVPGTELVAEIGVNAVTSKVVNIQIEAPEAEPEKAEPGEPPEKKHPEAESRECGGKERQEAEAHERGRRNAK